MKNWIVFALAVIASALLAFSARAALPQPDLLLQMHFAGAKHISADPHSAAFTNEFCSPQALALRAQTADKLSLWLSGWLQADPNGSVADKAKAAKLRPLLDDLQAFPFFLEIRQAANNQVEAAVAIQASPARAQAWQEALKPYFPAATFKTIGGWLIFDSNPALLGLGDRLVQKISAPATAWFDVDVNWPRLAQWHPLLKQLALPETQFSVTAPADYFDVSGKFHFPQDLALNLEPWRLPTNIIHTPFNSFTAVRGFASWWQSQPWAQYSELTPPPNQAFIWSLPQFWIETFAAVPVPSGASAVTQSYQELSRLFAGANALHEIMPAITPRLTNNEVDFEGLPWVAMKLRALTNNGQYLFGELGPNLPKSKPLPPELYRRLATPGLVFYHYEATGSRMDEMLRLTQLGLMITEHRELRAGSAAFNWMIPLGTNLVTHPERDHTDTEITQTGPAEFTFARKSPTLLTALELFALANWLEAPDFPGFNIRTPARPNRPFRFTPTTVPQH